jgi:drug/metabolite transporter (DMT)-like permease
VVGRIIVHHIGPFSASFLRFTTASLFLLGFMLRSRLKLPLLSRKQVAPLILLGLTGIFAYNVLFFAGLKTVTAGRASLIIATIPAFLALFSFFFFRERLGSLKILGIALSMSGAMVVIARGSPLNLWRNSMGVGELYLAGCVASWVVYSLIGKKVMNELSPLISVTYSCMIGAFFLFFPAAAEGLFKGFTHYPYQVWLGVLYLGFFASALGFLWFYEGIQQIGPSRSGVFINLVPICAILLGFVFLNEQIDLSLAGGAVLVITGVYFTNR